MYVHHGKHVYHICYKMSSQNQKRQKSSQARKLPLSTCTKTKEHTKLILSTCHRAKSKQAHMLPLSTWSRAKEHTKLTLNPCDRAKPQTKRATHKTSQEATRATNSNKELLTYRESLPIIPKMLYMKDTMGWGWRTIPELWSCPKPPESIHQMFSMLSTCKIKSKNESEQMTQHWS